MELLCLEKATEPYVQLVDDPVFTNDKRVLQNLYFLEKQYLPKFAYFKCVQTEITPQMRKVIAEWLLEVNFANIFLIFFRIIKDLFMNVY